MPPSQADRVRHILTAIAELERALAGKVYADLVADAVLCAAVERFLERMSEASRYIPGCYQRGRTHYQLGAISRSRQSLAARVSQCRPRNRLANCNNANRPIKTDVERIIREEKP